VFFGCDKYPECDFIIWDRPVGRACPSCNDTLVIKRTGKGEGKEVIQCVNTECDHKEEVTEGKQD